MTDVIGQRPFPRQQPRQSVLVAVNGRCNQARFRGLQVSHKQRSRTGGIKSPQTLDQGRDGSQRDARQPDRDQQGQQECDQRCPDTDMQEPSLESLDILDVRHDGMHVSVDDELAGEHIEPVIPRDFADSLVHATQRRRQSALVVDRNRPAPQPVRLIGG